MESYIELLKKWQMTINLVSASTLGDIWSRHIIDCLQLVDYIDEDEVLVDMGSGAGLPGIVLAIAGIKNVTLVESDNRKAAFLREASQFAEGKITVCNERVEGFDLGNTQTITARAFAPLPRLLDSLSKTLTLSHKIVLLKGNTYKDEVTAARKNWNFDYEAIPSLTQTESVILHLTSCQKRER